MYEQEHTFYVEIECCGDEHTIAIMSLSDADPIDHSPRDIISQLALEQLGANVCACVDVQRRFSNKEWEYLIENYPDFVKSFLEQISQEKEAMEELLPQKKKLFIDAFVELLSEDTDTEVVDTIIDNLKPYLDAYVDTTKWTDESGGWERSTVGIDKILYINNKEVAKWASAVDTEVFNPIDLATNTTDLAEASDSYVTPDWVKYLLKKLNLKDEKPVPAEISVPEQDENGDYAVYFEVSGYNEKLNNNFGGYDSNIVEKVYLVRYSGRWDAKQAVEIAEDVTEASGEDDRYHMELMEVMDDEEKAAQQAKIAVTIAKLQARAAKHPEKAAAIAEKISEIQDDITIGWKPMEPQHVRH